MSVPHSHRFDLVGLCAAAVAGAPAGAFAETAPGPTLALEPGPAMTGHLLQLTLSLALVVAVVFAVAWLAKRLQRLSGNPSGTLKVIANLSLGARERIVLVQAGDKQVLVGLAPGSIRTLHVLDKPLDEPVQQAEASPRASFRSLLSARRSA